MSSKRLTRTERPIKYLTQQQVRAFFQAIPKDRIRDRLLFGFAYRYGMRTQELCELPADAVDPRRGEIRVQGLKNGLERTYTLFRDLRPLVRKWEPRGDTYFHGRQGPLSRQRVWRLFKDYAEAAGLPAGYGVHSLRHSAAVHMLDGGHSTEEVQDLLRHRHITTTQTYAQLSPHRRNRYLRRLEDSRSVVRMR